MSQTIVPGQYITPILKVDDEEGIEKYVSGKGTTVTEIVAEDRKIPVIVGTILGSLIIKLIEKEEQEEQEQEQEHKRQQQQSKESAKTKNFIVSVIPKKNNYIKYAQELQEQPIDLQQVSNNLPKEGDIVLIRITRLTQKQAYSEILSVEGLGNVIQDAGIGANGELAHKSLGSGGGAQSLTNHSTLASSQTSQINAVGVDLGETFKGIIRSQDVRLTERDKVKIIDSFKPGDIVRSIIISLGDGSNYYLSTARNDLGVIFAKSEGGAGELMLPIDWQTMISPTTGIIEKRKCAKPI